MTLRSLPLAFAALCVSALATDNLSAQAPQNSPALPNAAGQSNAFNQSNPSTARGRTIVDESATIKCIHSYSISAQTDGLISEMMTDEGKSVKKGDHLLTIDDRVGQVEVRVAAKEWEAAQRQAEETANVEFAKKSSELADAEFKIESEMYRKNAVGESQLKRKKLEAEKARFGIRVSEVEHAKEVVAAEVAREKHEAAKVRLQLHRVVASHDGIIVRRLRDQGEWTRAGEPVLDFLGMQEMKVEARVPVSGLSITRLQGAPVLIKVPVNASEVVTIEANIDFVSPEIEQGFVRVSARVENQAPGGIWVLRKGMQATVEITPL